MLSNLAAFARGFSAPDDLTKGAPVVKLKPAKPEEFLPLDSPRPREGDPPTAHAYFIDLKTDLSYKTFLQAV